MDCKAKVSYFADGIAGDKDISWLEVSVQNKLVGEVSQSLINLVDVR